MIITISDIRQLGFCVRGQKRFAKQYNLNFIDFLTNGIDIELLKNTGHPEALEIVRKFEEKSK